MVIEARAVRATSSLAPEGRLDGFDLSLSDGLHALVGSPVDGVSLALAALAGRTRLQRGEVRLDGAPPREQPGAIVWLGRATDLSPLPGSMRVSAVIDLAARVRGGRRQSSLPVLASLGLERVASLRLRTLSRSDARAVALAMALAADARVLIVDEPLLGLEPDVASRAVQALQQRARDAVTVVVGTASEREAQRLGAEVHLVRGGRLVARAGAGAAAAAAAGETATGSTTTMATFRAVSSNARALLGSLAQEDAIVELESHGSAVRVGGRDAILVAAAIGRAAVRADVDLVSLERLESGGAT